MDQSLRPVVDETRGIYRVPRRAFVDQTVFERECRAIFDKCWLYLGHASELPNPGDFVTRKVAGRPMLFTRDKEDQYHALINVCPHRGAVVCRERKGSSPAFQCMYHGWVFANTGRLMVVPGHAGYPADYKDDPGKQLSHAPRFDRFGDFFFVSFAADGEDLATYLAGAGDYLKLVSEQSSKGMTIVGGTQEYSIRGNWKLLAENSVDGYHAASTHSTYLEYLKNANGSTHDTRLAGFGHDLGNGHAVIEYFAPWGRPIANWIPLWGEEGKCEIEAIQQDLTNRLGQERADRIAKQSRNMIIFPNLVINDVMAITVRTFWPTAPDYMEVNAWALAPAEESEWLRKFRLFNFTEFLGPGGFATPDDVEAIEKCQVGYQASREAQYNDISRGMLREGGSAYDDELQMALLLERVGSPYPGVWRMTRDQEIDAMLLQYRVQSFLFHEADLLDRWQLGEWEALFADEASYLVPPTDVDGDFADPSKSLFYIFDDRTRIHERVVRLEKKGAHSEFPRSKTRHLVSNVQAFQRDGTIEATASFAVWRSKDGNTDIFVGHYAYQLVEIEGTLRISEKKCVLDMDALRPHARISILL